MLHKASWQLKKGGENSEIMRNIRKGFTLIELLVVIGIIGILAAIVLVAVNPGRSFAQARNTTRQNDLAQVTSAIIQFGANNDGNLPGVAFDETTGEPDFPVCSSDPLSIDRGAGETFVDAGAVDIYTYGLANAGADDDGDGAADTGTTMVPTYIVEMPNDPQFSDGSGTTGYVICTYEGRVFAEAIGAELDEVVTVNR